MNSSKAIDAPVNDSMVTIEDHVKRSEVLRNTNTTRRLEYELNDKVATAKLLKGAKRMPIEIEENSTSSNIICSAGAWFHVVQPSASYWNDVKGEKTCKVGEYTIKVGGVKEGKERNGKHLNTKIVFYADRDKIVCHLYKTTQLILINGRGYKKFIELF